MSARRPLAEQALERTLALPGAALRPSRFGDGPAAWLAGREVLHLHGPGEVDLRLGKALIRDLKVGEDPRATHRKGSDWIAIRLATATDVSFVVGLVTALAEPLNKKPPA